ncbi:MAG: AzlC family ABC transporter permease [Clostridia bacterium]|nr:AzlC family ABC transporter permease [Clostridia bacterium]
MILEILDKKQGFKDGFPIFLGYFPIAITFGILSSNTGLTFFETISFSIIVFAGASQFIAVKMIAVAASPVAIILTTLFLNFRHFLMSASLSARLKVKHKGVKGFIGFFITDETFSVASFAKGQLTASYMMTMTITGYLGWCLGTAFGYLLGGVLPKLLQLSMGIGLYAMFVALLVPKIKGNRLGLLLAISSGLLNTFLLKVIHLSSGWSIVLSIVIISLTATIIVKGEKYE